MARDQLAMYGVPALAGMVTAVVLLGPGVERPVSSVRVQALACESAAQLGLRVQAVTHLKGQYQATSLDGLTLELEQGGTSLGSWQGRSGDSGYAEASLALGRPLQSGSARVEVRRGDRVLGAGDLAVGAPLQPVTHPASTLPSAPSMSVRLLRGFVVPPFPEIMEVTDSAVPAASASAAPSPQLAASAEGADVRPLGSAVAYDCHGERCAHRWRVEVSAKAPSVNLELSVRAGADTHVWRGPLEVRQGGLWLDPDAVKRGTLHLRAASPKDEVYVSLLQPSGRVWGAVVRMDNDERGFASGKVSLPELPEALPTTLLASSDPAESPQYTTAWPLFEDRAMVEPRSLAPVLDGLPAAIAAEQERQARVRMPAFGLVLAAGLFEILFLWRRNRLANARLAQHLREHPGAEGVIPPDAVTGPIPPSYLILFFGALVLAFVVLAAVAALA